MENPQNIRRTVGWGLVCILVGIISYNWHTGSDIEPMRLKLSMALIVVGSMTLVVTEFNKWWERRKPKF